MSTVHKDKLPVITEKGMCLQYAVTHEDFAWAIRGERGVVEAFEKVYDNKDLIVSFDAINFTLPYVGRIHFSSKLTVTSVALTLHLTSHGLIKIRIPRSLDSDACKVW
jgi:uncharacterized protein YprB with RNaseH-like and TPR domain